LRARRAGRTGRLQWREQGTHLLSARFFLCQFFVYGVCLQFVPSSPPPLFRPPRSIFQVFPSAPVTPCWRVARVTVLLRTSPLPCKADHEPTGAPDRGHDPHCRGLERLRVACLPLQPDDLRGGVAAPSAGRGLGLAAARGSSGFHRVSTPRAKIAVCPAPAGRRPRCGRSWPWEAPGRANPRTGRPSRAGPTRVEVACARLPRRGRAAPVPRWTSPYPAGPSAHVDPRPARLAIGVLLAASGGAGRAGAGRHLDQPACQPGSGYPRRGEGGAEATVAASSATVPGQAPRRGPAPDHGERGRVARYHDEPLEAASCGHGSTMGGRPGIEAETVCRRDLIDRRGGKGAVDPVARMR